MELNKLKRKRCFTKELLELGSWGFIEEEVISCANIIGAADKQIFLHKELYT